MVPLLFQRFLDFINGLCLLRNCELSVESPEMAVRHQILLKPRGAMDCRRKG